MSKSRMRWVAMVTLAIVMVMMAASGRLPTRADVASPAEMVQRAWDNAQSAGSYLFASDVTQTLIPRPVPEMIGERDTTIKLALDGAVDLPDRAYLELSVASGGREQAATLLRDGPQSFLLQDGELKPVEDALGLAAPSSDMLSYLAGAEEVTLLAPPEGHPELTRYGFALDGVAFERYIRAQAEEALRAEPGAPDNLTLREVPSLQKLSGQGELWVNAEGLPVRQVLDVEMPEVSEYYGAQLHLVVDLAGYGKVQTLPKAVQGADGAWKLEGTLTEVARPYGDAPAAVAEVHQSAPPPLALAGPLPEAHAAPFSFLPLTIAPSSLALFALIAVALVVIRLYRRNRRHAYVLITAILLPILVLSPVLQAGQVVHFVDRQAEAAQAAEEATPALLEALGVEQAAPSVAVHDEETGRAVTASAVPQLLDTSRGAQLLVESESALERCGEGEAGVDTDGDGLTDQVELCLGTDPLQEDSDRDGISDKVEVVGFTLNEQHWDSDPLSADTNRDGIPDTLEWSGDLAANGQAEVADLDGDSIPNLWDEDDDNDGVPDSQDLSPFALTGYTSELSLSTEGEMSAGTQLFEIAIQPQNTAHLRYATSSLDWPADDKGNVQDLDNTVEDLRLTPYLQVTTNVQPNEELAAQYGARSWVDDDGQTILLIPMQPVDDGGAIFALYGKVGYTADDTGDIQWQAQLVWMAQMQADWIENDAFHTGSKLLHQYSESFRLTGLRIAATESYEALVLGTPSEADDRYLIQLYMGLNDIYMGYQTLEGQNAAGGETALEEIYQRFTDPAATEIHRFGIPLNTVAMNGPGAYTSTDAGIAGVGNTLAPGFLADYAGYYGDDYRCRDANDLLIPCLDADGNEFHAASLLIATELHQGVVDLRGFALTGYLTADLSQLHANLADIPIVTTRALNLRMYEEGAGAQWQVVTPARMLELVEQRWADRYETTLDASYPELQAEHVRFLGYTFYLWAYAGNSLSIEVDGQVLVPEVPDETTAALNRALTPGVEIDDGLDYLALVTGLVEALGTSISWGQGIYEVTGLKADWGKLSLGGKWREGLLAGFGLAATAASLVMGLINLACDANENLSGCQNAAALLGANIAVDALGIAVQAASLVVMIFKAINKTLDAISTAGKVMGVVGLVIGIGMTWASFGIAVATSGGDPIVWRVALGMAIVSTIWMIFLFALNFIPVVGQIISAILSIIDTILSLFTGLFGAEEWSLSKIILNLFYDAKTLTVIDSAEFGAFSSALTDEDLGLIGGNTFRVDVEASGTISKTEDGNNDDLNRSWVEGRLSGPLLPFPPKFTSQNMSEPRDCTIIDDVLHCTNRPALGYALVPRINGLAQFTAKFVYATAWAEYGLYGAFRWATHTDENELPDPEADDYEAPEPNDIYLDVLPTTMDGLWTWSALTNHDGDGDGLTNEEEAALGTDPADWDSDDDGLSDHYEWEMGSERGANPLDADSDDDGLSDALERRIGTRINVADSDGDGLTDGEEYRHLSGGALVGGWQVTLPDGAGPYWVYSNPSSADDDGDGLNGAEEKVHALSPHAPNALVPGLSLSAGPLADIPDGRAGMYWLPGESVQFDIELANVAFEPVVTTLSLALPDWLETIAGGVMAGDRAPAMTQSGSTVSWAFTGGNTLQLFEKVSTSVTAKVKSDVASAAGEIALDLPYAGVQMHKTIRAVVDGDNPAVAIVAPPDGAYLNATSYVVGGSATDPTTWISERSLSIVPDGEAASYAALPAGQGPWAYSWALPATDGVYNLETRATDAMGHQSTASVSVTVDDTPPVVTLNWAMAGNAVHLSGTATDNIAGIERVQLAIDGQPWRSVEFTGDDWAYDWSVGIGAQGDHVVRARAADLCGNLSDIASAEIVVDRVAPSSIVNAGADAEVPPAVKANTSFNLTGVADEGGHLPLPAVPASLSSGMDVLDDSTVWLGISTIHDNDGGVLANWIGDFNADRMADLAVGLPGPEGDAGQVAVLYGRAGGWPTPPDLQMLAASGTRFYGAPGARLGSYLAAAGDANGDNYSDLLIGERDTTRAFLVLGNPGPLGGVTLEAGQTGYRALLEAPANIEGLASAGDADGDGYADLLIRADGTVYLVRGRANPWPETVDVAAEAVETYAGATGALGVGDVDGDQMDEWVVLGANQVTLHGWEETGVSYTTTDAAPRVVALGDVDGDGKADWLYSSGSTRTLKYGSGVTYTFASAGGFIAAPGDVNGDGRADLLAVNGSGVASVLARPASSFQTIATIAGVGGAANAPYAAGADLNADGSAELLLIPSQVAAEAAGFDAPNFSSGFISPQALPRGAASPLGDARPGLKGGMELRSTGPDTRYVDDDAVSNTCDGHTSCYTTIQAAVDASDGGGDTIIVYPGVYSSFNVPAGTNYDNLTIQGVSADAVFVEGGASNAVTILADAVHLSNLTVRNATGGVLLDDGAGEPVAGSSNETVIDHLVAHSVQNPIVMSEAAGLILSDSTLVGNGTDPIIDITPPDVSPYFWSNDADVPEDIAQAVAEPAVRANGGGLFALGGSLYAVPGYTSNKVYVSTPGTGGALGAWTQATSLPHMLPYSTGAYTSAYYQRSILFSNGAKLYNLQSTLHWPELGGRANNEIYALAVAPNGDLYVGGDFTTIGGVSAHYVVRWDGSAWHTLGSGLAEGTNSIVRALACDDSGNVYAGGWFTEAGDAPAGGIARWDGSAWHPLGAADFNGTSAYVYALAWDGQDLYVGGDFASVRDSSTVSYTTMGVARWRPSTGTWSALPTGGTGTNMIVHAMALGGGGPSQTGGYLYIGGQFTSVNGVAASHIARYDGTAWSAMGGGFSGTVQAITVASDGTVYAADSTVYSWDSLTSTWVSKLTASSTVQSLAASPDGRVYATNWPNSIKVLPAGGTAFQDFGLEGDHLRKLIVDSAGHLYTAWGITTPFGAAVSRWAPPGHYVYDPATNAWSSRTAFTEYPAAPAVDADGNIYGFSDTGSTMYVKYTADPGSWSWVSYNWGGLSADFLFQATAWADGLVYGLGKSSTGVWSFRRYDPVANTGVALSLPAEYASLMGAGVSLTWDGADCLYVLPGGGSGGYLRYQIGTDAWGALTTSTSFTVSIGRALARVGSYLYAYATPASGVTTNAFRSGPVGAPALRLTVDTTAFVAPEAASSFAWADLSSAAGSAGLQADIDTSNVWVGPSTATWSPALPTGATTLTAAEAAFVAPEDGLYRLGADSELTAGYHAYKAEAHVYTSEAACAPCGTTLTWGADAFATVREAVESGAARVLVHAGRYPQTFYLVSGVEIIGAGAEFTIIEPPAGAASALVTAEGVAGASLARVTLAGGAAWQGFLAEGGAEGLTLSRCIIRDLSTGARIRGDSVVTVVNNTIVRNGSGLVVEGTTPVNVRNTILAYNTTYGLSRGATPTSLSNTYNDFWGNGDHMYPTDDVGGGIQILDPRFRSMADNDLRLSASSPLIDMGAPNDPTAPGGGTRVDMGYAEYNAAGFYVSPDYAETGQNDGLTWGVDAFAAIQDALDAAAAAMHDLRGALPEGGYTVGVDIGSYSERLTVPSHVRLVGSGPTVSAIAAGNVGSTVTFDGVIGSSVSGFTIEWANASGAGVVVKGAASGISISRNVIRDNQGHGVSLAESSSADIAFNTIVDNDGAGIHASGTGAWADVRNNIVSGNAYGLQAASGALIRNDYNLLHNTTDVSGVTAGVHSVSGSPLLDSYYVPAADSPAIDAADPRADVPLAGGLRADLGYKELIACPLALFFGPQIESTVTGNSGVAQVEVAVVAVADPSLTPVETAPTTFDYTLAADGSPVYAWSQSVTKGAAGLYRVYSRATDEAGNVETRESDWYEGAFIVDTAAPTIAWGAPALPGSTDAAAVLAVVEASGALDTGAGSRDDLKQVTLSATRSGATASYPVEGGRAWILLPATGSYAVSAVATDEAGNQSTATATVAVSASSSVATVTEPMNNGAVPDAAVTLRGYVRFTAAGSTAVSVAVTGGGTVAATLDAPGAQFSAWSAEITLPAGDGAKAITVTPSLGGTAGTVTTHNLTLDAGAPTLSVTTPAAGSCVLETIAFAGAASDAGSGLARVEVSVDGGYTWRQATLSGGDWSLDWAMGLRQDYTSYPAQVRASDLAGNVTLIERAVAVDNLPPTDLNPATFDPPVGQHVQRGDSLTISWNTPLDAGGPVQVLLAVDQVADTTPTAAASGSPATHALSATGDWYVHLMAQDAAGNQALYHYGPWHVRYLSAGTDYADSRESIVLDGLLDLEHDEWQASDLLGIDARSGNPQALYASWDGIALYLGWGGAWWTLDGALWAYVNTTTGGTDTGLEGLTLPAGIAADVAVEISGPDAGTLWSWDGSAWVAGTLDFANGPSGDTEVRLDYAASAGQPLSMVALALPRDENEGLLALQGPVGLKQEPAPAPWAMFPTTNELAGGVSEQFSWLAGDIGANINSVSGDQPTARTVRMDVSTPQPTAKPWCGLTTLQYIIRLQNPEATAISGLTLDLAASTGLTYQTVEGATLTTGVQGDASWTLSLDELAAGATVEVIVSAQTDSDLKGLSEVSSSIALSAGGTLLTGENAATIVHRVDGAAPEVTIDALAGSAIAAGKQVFTGTASDGGSGVALVELSTDGGSTWHVATGTLAWSAEVTIPAGATSLTLQARATDGCDAQSAVASRTFAVDSAAPTIDWTAPAVIADAVALLGGTATDLPAGALVAQVSVQIDSETTAWQPALGPYAPDASTGAQAWDWAWYAPTEDGVSHLLRARAIDQVGNATVGAWQSTIVDVVAPAIEVVALAPNVTLPDDPVLGLTYLGPESGKIGPAAAPFRLFTPLLRGGGGAPRYRPISLLAETTLLEGTVTDGSGVQAVRIRVISPTGAASVANATLSSGAWAYTPELAGWAAGAYSLRVEAEDIYGNIRVSEPYLIQVVDKTIEGLTASNNGPVLLGQEVTLTAGVTAGSNVVYTWDFGDGSAGDERVETHIYGADGEYTARVTASNSVSSVTAETTVVILALSVEAGADQSANEGDTVSVAATFTDGRTGVVHTATIDWGDGTAQTAGTVDEALFTIAGGHAYADNGVYVVTVEVSDGAGHTASDSLSVTVANVAPTASLGNDGPKDEASAVTVSFTNVVDPSSEDTLTYSFDWDNDGNYEIVDQTEASAQHTWPNDGTYTVRGRVKDDDGGLNAYATDVVVNNVAPVVDAGADATINEGSAFNSSGSFADPGADPWSATVDYGDGGGAQTLALAGKTFTLSHTYADDDADDQYTVTVCVTDDDATRCDTAVVTVLNVAPVVAGSPASQAVQYSEAIAEIAFTATDVAADDLTAVLSGAPASLALGERSCSVSDGVNTCTWKVNGSVSAAAGTYTLRLTVSDDDGGSTYAEVTVIVEPEEAAIAFDDDNPVAVLVASAGGSSIPFELTVCVSEDDDPPDGDINLAQVGMSLVPVGPGGSIVGTAIATTVEGGHKCVTFGFSGAPVNAYVVQVTVGGGYYAGYDEDVVVVYDPSLGFTCGGGWFYWPDTANEESGYLGDRTSLGYTMKYNKKGGNVQGNLVMIRHLPDGTIYRVKSNALYGLALGEDSTVPMGWATFSGKSTYQEPGWPRPIGNYVFTAYVEDRNEPGAGVDRFWIEVVGGLSLERPAVDHAIELGGGNIVVPHKPARK